MTQSDRKLVTQYSGIKRKGNTRKTQNRNVTNNLVINLFQKNHYLTYAFGLWYGRNSPPSHSQGILQHFILNWNKMFELLT